MHGLSIAHSIVEIACEVAQRENSSAVKVIYLSIGELSCVVDDALRFAMELDYLQDARRRFLDEAGA